MSDFNLNGGKSKVNNLKTDLSHASLDIKSMHFLKLDLTLSHQREISAIAELKMPSRSMQYLSSARRSQKKMTDKKESHQLHPAEAKEGGKNTE